MLYSEQRCGKEGRVSKTRRERESRGGTLQGSRETTFSSDSSDWCRIKIVKIIFFCGLRVIYRKARDWCERLEEAENELKQEVGRTSLLSTSFFQALAEKGRVEERVRGDWWSTEVRWSHLCVREVYRLELGTCVWSLLFSGSGCEGEQGERSNETEEDNAREGEHKSRGSVFRGRLLNSDLSDIMICRATWRACPGSVWREWRGESVE